MYFYNNNPILITQFICITISLLSILGVMIVFILGKGWKYFIVKLFATQIICQLFFYIPQLFCPFIYNIKLTEAKDDQDNDMYKVDDWIWKLQGYLINSSFIAATIISLNSCQVIKECLTASKKNIQNKNRIYFIHTMAAVITFIICLPTVFYADFHYYGSTWKNEMIYYVTNIDLESTNIITWIFLIINFTINIIILIWSIVYHIQVKKLKSQIKDSIFHDVDNYSALNLYCIPLTLVFCWTINLIFKMFDFKSEYIRELNSIPFSILFYLPQILLPLQGFNYASIFFYAFHLQLVPNLPKSLRSTYLFFAKISYCNLIFGKIKNIDISQESLLYKDDSANLSTSSLIRKDESSTNR